MVSCNQLLSEYIAATHGDAATTIGTRVLQATPLMVAALYYLLSPFFIGRACKGLSDYLKGISSTLTGPTPNVPLHLTPDAVAATCEWVIDAPQLIPTLLLPLAAAVFTLQSQDVPAIVLAFASVVICAATLWIYSVSPLQYRARKLWKYTIVAVAGVILNAAAAGL